MDNSNNMRMYGDAALGALIKAAYADMHLPAGFAARVGAELDSAVVDLRSLIPPAKHMLTAASFALAAVGLAFAATMVSTRIRESVGASAPSAPSPSAVAVPAVSAEAASDAEDAGQEVCCAEPAAVAEPSLADESPAASADPCSETPVAASASVAIAVPDATSDAAPKAVSVNGANARLRKSTGSAAAYPKQVRTSSVDDPYLESDGVAVLNTRYCLKRTSRIEVDFALVDADMGWNQSRRVFGADSANSSAGMAFSLYCTTTNQNGISDFGFVCGNGTDRTQQWTGVHPDTARHVAVIDIPNDVLSLVADGVEEWSATTGISSFPNDSTQPVALFGRFKTVDPEGGFETQTKARIYRFTVYEGGELVHDYEPCVKDGLAGLRDRVSGAFLANGKYWNRLAVGGDARAYTSPYVATPADNADTYINTGYQVISNTCVALDASLISDWAGTLAFPFGASGGSNDTVPGNYNLFLAYFRHDTGFTVRTFNNSGGWIGDIVPATALTNGAGAVAARRTFSLDTYLDSRGYGKGVVMTAGETNGVKDVHPLRLTKPSYHSLCLASGHAGSGTKTSLKIYGCEIRESGEVVRRYVPDVTNGTVAVLRDAAAEGEPVYVGAAAGTLSAGGFVPAITSEKFVSSPNKGAVLVARAPFAVAYRWLKNGEEIDGGANGTLTATWRKGPSTDVYAAMAVYSLGDETLYSDVSESVEVVNVKMGMAMYVK